MKKIFNGLSDQSVLLILAACGTIIHIMFNGQYGFHRDELDILMNARQLDWGYVSYPPFTPFIARIGLTLFGESLRWLRVFSAISQGFVLVLTGTMAKDMGGNRKAQLLAAVAVYIAPIAMVSGTMIQYMSFDYLWWVVLSFFFVRLLATGNHRYWLGIGAAIGFGMMTKYTILFWVAGLFVSVLVSPIRKHLRSKWLWIGVFLSLLIFLPNLIWQIQHDFISIEFLSSIHARDIAWGRSAGFLLDQLYTTTNPTTLPIWIAGVLFCWIPSSGKRFRPLCWMFATTFFLLVINQGRGYYMAAGYVMFLAAGSVWFEQKLESLTRKKQKQLDGVLWGGQILGFVMSLILMKQIVPINSFLWDIVIEINELPVEMIGWEELTEQVADIYQVIPEDEKSETVILVGNYGEAGALDLYGKEYHLPPVITGSNNYWYRGYGSFEPQTAIVLGIPENNALSIFKSCEMAGKITNQYHVANEETYYISDVFVCRGPLHPWDEMWPNMRWYQ